jgi:hypothetical protein
MTSYLYAQQIKVFDYAKAFADPLRNRIRDNAQIIANAHGVSIEHVNNAHLRKEDLVSKVLAQRGDHPGLVPILSAMEACSALEPWHDKQTHKTYLHSTPGKCLHYYVYFMDAEVGLCYLRVPTWCPFRLQFYGNGHSWLARQLTQRASISPRPITPLFVSTTSHGRNNSLMRFGQTICIDFSMLTSRCVAPCSKPLPRLIIGV